MNYQTEKLKQKIPCQTKLRNNKTATNIMFAKKHTNVLNVGFCAYYKLCA